MVNYSPILWRCFLCVETRLFHLQYFRLSSTSFFSLSPWVIVSRQLTIIITAVWCFMLVSILCGVQCSKAETILYSRPFQSEQDWCHMPKMILFTSCYAIFLYDNWPTLFTQVAACVVASLIYKFLWSYLPPLLTGPWQLQHRNSLEQNLHFVFVAWIFLSSNSIWNRLQRELRSKTGISWS